jgi:hypothetical protein
MIQYSINNFNISKTQRVNMRINVCVFSLCTVLYVQIIYGLWLCHMTINILSYPLALPCIMRYFFLQPTTIKYIKKSKSKFRNMVNSCAVWPTAPPKASTPTPPDAGDCPFDGASPTASEAPPTASEAPPTSAAAMTTAAAILVSAHLFL